MPLTLRLLPAITAYLAHLRRSGRGPSTQSFNRHVLDMLYLASQNISVSEMGPPHIAAFWDVFRCWPRNAARYGERLLSDADLMQIGWNQERGPSPQTQQRAARVLDGFFAWLHASQPVPAAPASREDRSIRIRRRTKAWGAQARRPLVMLGEAIACFERANSADGMNPQTRQRQAAVLGLFLASCSQMPVAQIHAKQVAAFRRQLQDDIWEGRVGVGPTLAQADQALVQFFQWLWCQGAIREMPAEC